MARVCKVCAHQNTKEIENDIVQGVAHTTIAKKYGVHNLSVRYHAEHHLPEKLVQAVQDKDASHAENILGGIHDLLTRTKKILDGAEERGHNRLALEAIKEARSTYELLSKIAAKLAEYQQQSGQGDTGAPRTLADLYDEERGEMKTLDALTDEELKVFSYLQAKIAGTIPEDDMDENTRIFVQGVNESYSYENNNNNNNSDPDSPRNGLTQNKNTQKIGGKGSRKMRRTTPPDDDLDLDLDDLDLSLDKPDEETKETKSSPSSSNIIPSEETDPKWLRKWRKRNGQGPMSKPGGLR